MWTEHQIIAAARGLPVPAADESPPEELINHSPPSSSQNLNNLTVPIMARSPSQTSANELSPTNASFSVPSPPSPLGSPTLNTPFFRGRAKTLAALTTSRNNSDVDITPKEVQLPRDQYVNGQRLELYLYKDASECPICFLYYPPYLNKTRCCDQSICSECFVQIKRPDPHPPEHHGDENGSDAPPQPPAQPTEEYQLVSEAATCPFCKMAEFGITYNPPPFKRGLAYAGHSASHGHSVSLGTSAMSSSSSLQPASMQSGTPPPVSATSKRRKPSLGVNEPSVITTDKVRPDWAKKLSDARAHALRRAAAATALHNAAYVLGNAESAGRFGLGRRRRTFFGDQSAEGGAPVGGVAALMAAAGRQSSNGGSGESSGDLFPGRGSSRRPRIEDIEELMMMEAIRLSIAAEEERRKKEEKENEKNRKKEEKTKAKEQKKLEKQARKSGGSSLYHAGSNASGASSSLQIGESSTSAGAQKGKEPNRSGSIDSYATAGAGSIADQASVLSTGTPAETGSKEGAQRHLEQSRAQLQPAHGSENRSSRFHWRRHNSRQLSIGSSFASTNSNESLPLDSPNHPDSNFHSPNISGVNLPAMSHSASSALNVPGYHNAEDTPPVAGTPSGEPMFNFRSLAGVIDHDGQEGEALMEYGDVVTPSAEEANNRVFGESTITPTNEVSRELAPAPTPVQPSEHAKHVGISVLEGSGGSSDENVVSREQQHVAASGGR